MNQEKYFNARASGYSPSQAMVYARGGNLPNRLDIWAKRALEQRRARNVRQALKIMAGSSKWAWLIAYHGTRRTQHINFKYSVTRGEHE
jgi:hypothetical protein